MAQITRKKKESFPKYYVVHLWMKFLFGTFLVFLWKFGTFVKHQEYPTTTRQGANPEGTKSAYSVNNNNIVVRPEEALDHPDYVYQRHCSHESASIAAVQACYPGAPLQRPRVNDQNIINNNNNNNFSVGTCDFDKFLTSKVPLSWNAIQSCLVGTKRNFPDSNNLNNIIPPPPPPPVTEIHVIGERNSGTKWLQQEIAKCFPKKDTAVRCHRDFLRSKHFFQPPVQGNYETSLVIAIVRDPLEWLAAMREKPYHMPYHMKGFDMSSKKQPAIPLDWDTFLKRAEPWTMPGPSAHDQQYLLDNMSSKKRTGDTAGCVQGFSFDEVTPCIFDNSTVPRSKWRGHMPVYELQRDRSGQPFGDLLKLRSDKILNFFLEIPLLMNVGGYAAVRYEDLLRNGTQSFLQQLASMMGMSSLPDACRPQEPHPEWMSHRSASIPANVRQWLEDHLVLETEQMLGYR